MGDNILRSLPLPEPIPLVGGLQWGVASYLLFLILVDIAVFVDGPAFNFLIENNPVRLVLFDGAVLIFFILGYVWTLRTAVADTIVRIAPHRRRLEVILGLFLLDTGFLIVDEIISGMVCPAPIHCPMILNTYVYWVESIVAVGLPYLAVYGFGIKWLTRDLRSGELTPQNGDG